MSSLNSLALLKKLLLTLAVLTLLIASSQSFANTAQSVKAERVRMAPLEELLPLSGTLVSPKRSDLSAQESGYVAHRHINLGDRVAKGQPLFILDATLAKMEAARLALEVTEARHLYEEFKRLKHEADSLVNAKHLSQTELQTRQVNMDTQLARLKQLELAHAMQQERVARHEVSAPFAGVIAEILTEQGQWLDNNIAALRLIQMDPLEVEVAVPERFYGRVQLNDTAYVLLGEAQETMRATVTRVIPVNDSISRSYRVRITIDNPDWLFSPGMMAKVSFVLHGSKSLVKQVPNDAVQRDIKGAQSVWVARYRNGQSYATQIPVAVKRRMGAWVEVESKDLQEQDAVVVLGNENLKADQLLSVEIGTDDSDPALRAQHRTQE